MTEKIKPSKKTVARSIKQLPAELDNETVIFSYGSLLDHNKLRELLKNRPRFKILETRSVAKAARLARENPRDIVILKNVRLDNVRVSIVTEMMLRRWYKNSGGDLQHLIDAGATTREIPPALFLYARPAKPDEKGKMLNGGLICNLSREDVAVLDSYEWEPVLKRERVPNLIIGNRAFIPKHIAFYAGTESAADITPEEKADRASQLNLNRNPGHLSPQAKWHRNVRRK